MNQVRFKKLKARREWFNTMKRLYPNFCKKKWAMTSYRILHPQAKI